MIKTWYLFRHALSTRSVNGYGDKILTAEILPEEIKPIEKMAKYLNRVEESINYRSDIIRCRQTAEIISKITGKKFIPDNRLNEYYDENFDHVSTRIKQFIGEVDKIKQPNILVCSHGAIIAGIKKILLNEKFYESDLMDYPNCGELLIINGNKISNIDFNISD
jgi:broad specificity phosphatase PhoE